MMKVLKILNQKRKVKLKQQSKEREKGKRKGEEEISKEEGNKINDIEESSTRIWG